MPTLLSRLANCHSYTKYITIYTNFHMPPRTTAYPKIEAKQKSRTKELAFSISGNGGEIVILQLSHRVHVYPITPRFILLGQDRAFFWLEFGIFNGPA